MLLIVQLAGERTLCHDDIEFRLFSCQQKTVRESLFPLLEKTRLTLMFLVWSALQNNLRIRVFGTLVAPFLLSAKMNNS